MCTLVMKNLSKLVILLEQDYYSLMGDDKQGTQETLLAGLNWPTPYWINCALKWINQGAGLIKTL